MGKFFDDDIENKIKKVNEKQKNHSLWVEKYRPITLSTFIGNDKIKEKFESYIENNDIPNILLFGSAGVGKTSAAKLLVNNIKCDYLYINASDENSVDDVRTKLKSFAQTVGFTDLKIIILDEADMITMQGQAALRNLMETYSANTRFILTCNYIEKILDPIVSRCQTFEMFPPSKKDVAIHTSNILIKEEIQFDKKNIAFLVNAYYPDIRKIIGNCQLNSRNKILSIDTESVIESEYKLKILEIIKDKSKNKRDSFNEIRQIVADNHINDFTDIYKLLYDSVDDYAEGSIGNVIMTLFEMSYKSTIVVDKEIAFMATILEIINIVK